MNLLAPNGKPSNLTPEQYALVRTPAFKRWFGDWENSPETASKVVDGNGEPLVVFHGTTSDFNIFSLDKVGSGTKANLGNLGVFFTDDKTLATDFTRKKWTNQNSTFKKGARVVEVFLKIKKPKYMTIDGFILMDNKNRDKESVLSIRKDLLKKGYDGIIVEKAELYWQSRMREFDGKQYVILENNKNIKLADGSNTTFDSNNPDIRFGNGGSLSKTPAPKKERIFGSKINKPKSSESKNKASSIILSPKVISSIKSILENHNDKHPNKKIPLSTAKAVVRRGMGAYSSTHRPTIKGGKPNSRVAWGLARLNAFVYKIQKGHSKSGKYIQDDDLINELGYKVKKYADGGIVKDYSDIEYNVEYYLHEFPNPYNKDGYPKNIQLFAKIKRKEDKQEKEVFIGKIWCYLLDAKEELKDKSRKLVVKDILSNGYEQLLEIEEAEVVTEFQRQGLYYNLIKELSRLKKIPIVSYKWQRNRLSDSFWKNKHDNKIKKIASSYIFYPEKSETFNFGGLTNTNLLSSQEVEYKLGRSLDLWNDDIIEINGLKYKKCFLKPEYQLIESYKSGGQLDEEKKETYQKWKKLVNMSKSELERFYNSEEGKIAGLTAKEAKEQGIDSGRESARWIMKMKDTPVSEWTPNMWRWAKKQISFVSRMSGMKGKLYDEKGRKTRKHLALLIWGNNPEK